MLFDIKEFERRQKQYPNKHEIDINLGDGKMMYLRTDDNSYEKVIEKYNGYHRHNRDYYKPSGKIKYDSTSFYSIPVGTAKFYNQSGELTRSIYYTPDDWADKLFTVMKNDYGLDLSIPNAFKILKIYDANQKTGVLIQHLNGEALSLDTYDPVKNFILLDFETLKFVAKGEIHSRLPEVTPQEVREVDAYPRTIDEFYIDGKPVTSLTW